MLCFDTMDSTYSEEIKYSLDARGRISCLFFCFVFSGRENKLQCERATASPGQGPGSYDEVCGLFGRYKEHDLFRISAVVLADHAVVDGIEERPSFNPSELLFPCYL
jgi:hypothetical protein